MGIAYHYYWVNNKIVTHAGQPMYRGFVPKNCVNAPCVDTNRLITAPRHRYGYYNEKGDWTHLNKEKFPAEFKLSLLLLNIE